MSHALRAYLALERIGIEADRDHSDFADFNRDHIEVWWDAMTEEERTDLRSRSADTHDEINKIRIVEIE